MVRLSILGRPSVTSRATPERVQRRWLGNRKSRGVAKELLSDSGCSPARLTEGHSDRVPEVGRQKCHPDLNDEPDATEKFMELVEAYTALKEPGRRNDFDAQIISEYCMSFLGQFETGEAPGKLLKREFLHILSLGGVAETDSARKRPEPEFYRILQRLGLR